MLVFTRRFGGLMQQLRLCVGEMRTVDDDNDDEDDDVSSWQLQTALALTRRTGH